MPLAHETTASIVPGEGTTTGKAILDDSQIIWREAVSANSKTFLVGSLAPSNSAGAPESNTPAEAIDGALATTASFSTKPANRKWAVHWPVDGNICQWRRPSEEIFQEANIAQYCLARNEAPLIYSWILYINTNATQQYYFTDESGDTYGLWCFLETNHYVKFNPEKPMIVKVSAS